MKRVNDHSRSFALVSVGTLSQEADVAVVSALVYFTRTQTPSLFEHNVCQNKVNKNSKKGLRRHSCEDNLKIESQSQQAAIVSVCSSADVETTDTNLTSCSQFTQMKILHLNV